MKLNYVVLALCMSAFFGCKEKVKSEETSPKSLISTAFSEDNKRPSNTITYQEMARMFEQYDNNQKKVLDDNLGMEETISSFYTIDQLKQYIAYVERLSKEKDIPLTGIRIFSAAYPENYNIKEYQKRQTLIFSPTTTVKGKKNVAYEPLYSKKGDPVAMKDFLDKFTNENTRRINRASIFPNPFAKLNMSADLESSSANRGTLTPPYE